MCMKMAATSRRPLLSRLLSSPARQTPAAAAAVGGDGCVESVELSSFDGIARRGVDRLLMTSLNVQPDAVTQTAVGNKISVTCSVHKPDDVTDHVTTTADCETSRKSILVKRGATFPRSAPQVKSLMTSQSTTQLAPAAGSDAVSIVALF